VGGHLGRIGGRSAECAIELLIRRERARETRTLLGAADRRVARPRWQGIYGPDGIFYDWYDKPFGRDSDQYFMQHSNVNAILQGIAEALGLDYWVHLDKGYANSSHTQCAAHGPAPVSVQQVHDNWLMERGRVSVEWGFGKIYVRCPFVKRPLTRGGLATRKAQSNTA
jgi:hypothetical protein